MKITWASKLTLKRSGDVWLDPVVACIISKAETLAAMYHIITCQYVFNCKELFSRHLSYPICNAMPFYDADARSSKYIFPSPSALTGVLA